MAWKDVLKFRIEEPINPKTMGEMVTCPNVVVVEL